MKMFIPYRTNIMETIAHLKAILMHNAKFVNIKETAIALVYEYFSAPFNPTGPHSVINNTLVIFNKDQNPHLLTQAELVMIAACVNSSFWVSVKFYNDCLNHFGATTYQARPTDCYFVVDASCDIMIYVPVETHLPYERMIYAVPENALIACNKGGTI